MRRSLLSLTGAAVLAFLVVACAQSSASPTPGGVSIVGTWRCGYPEAPGQDLVEIRADGTVAINGVADQTWSVEGDRGAFNAADGGNDPFAIEPGHILFDFGYECTPAE